MVKLKTPGTEFTIVLAFSFVSFSGFAQQEAFESPAGTKFLLYTPPGYFSSSSTYPLLLSLHSKGEVGDDLTELTSNNPEQMPSRLIYLNKWPQDLPFIVLTPQLKPDPTDPDAQWPARYVDEVVNFVLANYRVDHSRIYVTGISRGGTGAWTYAAAYPQKVAALLPIAGRTDLTQACRLKNIPVWAFNGDGDLIVVPQYSIDMADAISACQPAGAFRPRVNILNARDHNGWNEVYNGSSGYKIYEWLLMFRKNDPSNRKPYVNAGPDRHIRLRSDPLHIIGDFFDSDGNIANVTWQQTRGVPLTLNDTGSRMLKISDLKTGVFEFELLVTDNKGVQNSDKVNLEISETAVTPAITELVLFNGKTNTAIRSISEGDVIDMAALGVTEINVRAIATSGTASVKFAVNNDESTRFQNAGPYFIKSQTTAPEWKITDGVYLICATPYPKTYLGGTPGVSQCFKVTVTNGATELCPGTGKIRQEFWTGISGLDIASIPLHSPPDFINDLTHFEGPASNLADNYGSRIRGYVCPPTSGIYTFWISGDDRAQLWLSTSDKPEDKVMIASTGAFTGRRQWTKFATQKSVGIRLVAKQKYYIEALHKEATGGDHVSVGWKSPAGAVERPIPWFRLLPFEGSEGGGTLTREVWTGVPGTTVSSIPVTQPPNATGSLTIFEAPTNTADNFGARIRGYVSTPASGNYIFWISGDDHVELWLSTDEDPANRRRIAYHNGWTTPRQWTKYTSQQSVPVALIANQKYYVEALHKEALGGDHVAVGWQLPDGALERPITGSRLSPFQLQSVATFGGAAIEAHDQTVMQDGEASLDLFPNPKTHGVSELTIRGYNGATDIHEITIEIDNVMGQVIYAEKIVCESDCRGFSLTINKDLTPGIYLVHVIADGKSRVKRLVVK